jgi:hypothetical protein
VDFTTLDAAKKQDRGGYILLKVAQPVVPDFAVVLYEDPSRLTSAERPGTVAGLDAAGLQAQSTRFVVQVLEIATGRLVSGASVSLFSQNTDKLIGTHVTNGNGEAAFSLTLPERDRVEISAEYRATNGRRLEGFRSFPVADLGTVLRHHDGTDAHAVGRDVQRQDARVVAGAQAALLAGQPRTGVGTATSSIPTVQPGVAARPTAGGLMVGSHNVVALGGSNVLVASAPAWCSSAATRSRGAASARRAPGDPAIARAANLGAAMGGLLMSVTSTGQARLGRGRGRGADLRDRADLAQDRRDGDHPRKHGRQTGRVAPAAREARRRLGVARERRAAQGQRRLDQRHPHHLHRRRDPDLQRRRDAHLQRRRAR